MSNRLSVVELRDGLADILNRAEYRGERIIVHRRGKDAAAIIPIRDLRLLERYVEELEDRLDIEVADAALADPEPPVPYAAVREQLGITDGPRAKRGKTRAGTKAL